MPGLAGWFDLELGWPNAVRQEKPGEKSKEPAGRRSCLRTSRRYGMADVPSKRCGVYPCGSA